MGEAELNAKPDDAGGGESPEARSALVDRLFREHNSSLMSFLVMRLRSVHEARDVAQEAYVRLLQLDRPGAVSLLRAYLFRTAANLAVDRLRRRAVRDRVATELFEEISEDETPERTVLARQEFEIVRGALSALPEKCRRAVPLRSRGAVGNICGAQKRQATRRHDLFPRGRAQSDETR